MRHARWAIAALILAAGFAGCSSSSQEPDPRDTALKDPMNYSPAGGEKWDVSGGGIINYDKKAVGKDMNDVLSP